MVLPEPNICERARLSRDPRFDGRFVVGVLTTGIYCRPVCPARPPAKHNVRYYATPAAAQDAGFRPCLRCRPEAARRLPEWTVSSQTVVKGLRLIDAGFLNDHSVGEMAERLNLSSRQLNRVFSSEVGATPASLGSAHRLQLAKRLIDHGGMSLANVAMQAGYGSVRRFNDAIKATFGRPPSTLRRHRQRASDEPLELHLAVRQPYNASWVFGFLAKRALAGLEVVDGLKYYRCLTGADGAPLWLEVRWQGDALVAAIPVGLQHDMSGLLQRIRRVFDLDADSSVIDAHLGEDPDLSPWVREAPGLRVPGAWDGFETAVRAVLGQQVSVARATTLADLLIARYGAGAFPDPEALARADPAEIGMPRKRGAAISRLAREVSAGRLQLDECVDSDTLRTSLCRIEGIGPWTASYIALRVAKDPDAFPESDWVVLKMLGTTAAGARKRAERWAPWRGYALMYLWYGSARRGGNKQARTYDRRTG
ncbi:MAG: helix-turn-helix domain-containing protein [Gammaproteobacteria bacterium]|nr:helix-turn-helix domain-containing protein [Gammaproteobacteria bacterium]